MIWRALVTLALLAVPARAQENSPSSPSAPSFEAPAPDAPVSEPPPAPADLADADLEQVVRAAYAGARAYALAHGNYFARDGIVPPLRDAVAAALGAAGFGAVDVPAEPVADLAAGRVCRAAPGTELRLGANLFGDGVTLVAVTDARYFAYVFDPHADDDIKVTAAADCTPPT